MGRIGDFFSKNFNFLLLFAAVCVVYGISVYQRAENYRAWMDDREEYVVGDWEPMSDMDSYFWLRMAKESDAGRVGKGLKDTLKGYPDRVPFALNDRASLLSELIRFGKVFTGGDYYLSGLVLVAVLAGLFVFPLLFYCGRLGFGPAAILGGLIGSFSQAYYYRTMMGRVDTDLLNLFFPLTIGCFIVAMGRDRTLRTNGLLALGAGAGTYLFVWWYQQASFVLVYLLVLLTYVLLNRFRWKHVLLLTAVFLIACGPGYVLQTAESTRVFLRAYVSPPPTGRIIWPDIMATVNEAQRAGVIGSLKRVHGFLPLAFAGLGGLAYLYLRRFKQMIPMTPLVILGVWGVLGQRRFTMYLAPGIGLGVGVLVELVIGYVARRMKLGSTASSIASIAGMFALFAAMSGYTGFSEHSMPILPVTPTRAILNVKERVPKHSAMFTPFWEYGYPLMEIGEFATYNDGGLQSGARSTLPAKAMFSTRQQDVVAVLSYLEDHGFNGLLSTATQRGWSGDEMMSAVFGYDQPFKGKDVYVFYLENMLWKFNPMSYLGAWDFEKKTVQPTDYVELHCFGITNNVITCSDGTIDLTTGLMNDGSVDIPLRASVWVNDGYIVKQDNYEQNKEPEPGYYLQILMKENKLRSILVADDRLFWTNFNQQFLLGNYDRRYFEEVYNDFPVARVLKVKNQAEGSSGPQGPTPAAVK